MKPSDTNEDNMPATDRKRLVDFAKLAGPYLLTHDQWMHRRVHHVSFTTSEVVHNSISVDFSIPDGYPRFERLPDGRATYFVPLMVLRKWPPLMRLDLIDDQGTPFPLLTTAKNQKIDAEALVAAAPDGHARDALTGLLKEIVTESGEVVIDRLNDLSDTIATFDDEMAQPELEAWAEVGRLAATLATNSILWARVTALPLQRMIVKVRYETPVAVREPTFGRRVLAGLSWSPLRVRLPIRDIGSGASYHLQIEPPEDLEVHRATLKLLATLVVADEQQTHGTGPRSKRVTDLWWGLRNTARFRRYRFIGKTDGTVEDYPREPPPPDAVYRRVTEHQAYLYVTGRRSQIGLVEVDLATTRRGIRPAAASFALLTTVFMGCATAIAPGFATHVDSGVAILLFVPLILGYLIVNPGEHPLARRRLIGVRLLVGTVAALPAAAAVALVSFRNKTPPSGALTGCFLGLTLIGVLLSVLLCLSWMLPLVKDPVPELSPVNDGGRPDNET